MFSAFKHFAHQGHIYDEIEEGGGPPVITNGELREDGSFELREDGTFELRE